MNAVYVSDCTLRDAIYISPVEAAEIAHTTDLLGIDEMEIGIADVSGKDRAYFDLISRVNNCAFTIPITNPKGNRRV